MSNPVTIAENEFDWSTRMTDGLTQNIIDQKFHCADMPAEQLDGNQSEIVKTIQAEKT